MRKGKKTKVTKINNFGVVTRRWQNNDHLVVVGHNETTQSLFMFNQRQLSDFAKGLPWGLMGVHNPTKRMERVLQSIDDGWFRSTECRYHVTYSIEGTVVVHYHVVVLRSLQVPDAVRTNQDSSRLGYFEFPKENIAKVGFSKGLQPVIAEAIDTLTLQPIA